MSRISGRRGSHRMLRLPSARGPHSIRPWNQPTTLPFAISAAVSAAERIFVLDFADLASARSSSARASMKRRANFAFAELRSPVGMLHDERARMAERLMPYIHGRANRQSRVARSGLNIYFVESGLLDDLSVSHTIERDPAGQTQFTQPGIR